MECPSCSATVTADHRFCPRCGGEIDHPQCRQCQARLPTEARFCPDCGAGIEREGTTPAASDGLTAVLVAEFAIPAAASEQLDSKARASRLASGRARISDLLSRAGGRVTREVGERVVAIFEARTEPSEAPRTAIEAALSLRAEASQVELRSAVHLGPAARADDVGTKQLQNDAQRFDAIADVASQLLDVCKPGAVIATRMALDALPGQFVVRDVDSSGDHPDAMIVTSMTGVRAGATSSLGAYRTPFVARSVELSFLTDRWHRAAANAAQALLVRGEAGIGKSRLIAALRDSLAGEDYSWIECQCALETRRSPFRPIASLFEQVIGLRTDDSPEMVIERLERALDSAGFPLDETMPLFSRLIGVELPADYPAIPIGREEVRLKTLDWLTTWVVRIAEEQPTALVIEDLHWSDPSTLDFVNRMLELIHDDKLRILLLLVAREEFQPSWPNTEQIFLPRFSPTEIDEMARAVASGRPIANVLTREVGVRSDGIPLFIEEFTEDILASEADHDEGPVTIETSMLRRVARISDPAVARLLSVAGLECSRALLARVATEWSEDALEIDVDHLLSAGILRIGRDPTGETLRFKHALVRDALYDDLDPERRREYHRRVADAQEALEEMNVPVRPEDIAYHREQAGDAQAAIDQYQRAAAFAVRTSSHAEAVLHLRAALDLLRSDTASGAENSGGSGKDRSKARDEAAMTKELELLVALGPSLLASLGYGDPQVAEVFVRAQSLCDHVSEPGLLFRALYGMSTYYQARGSRVHSGDLAGQCLELANQIGDPALRVLGHQRIGLSLLYGGEIDPALSHLEEALSHYDAALHRPLAYDFGGDMGVHSRAYAAMGYAISGRPDRARQYVRACLADAREGGHPHTICFALSFCGVVLSILGDVDRVRRLSRENVDESERHGFPLWSGIGHVLHGWARAFDPTTRAGATEEIRQALEGLERIGSVVGTSTFYQMYADALIFSGAEQGALDALATALEFAETTESPWWNAQVLRMRGEILDRRGQTDQARADFELAVETARSQGSRSFELGASAQLERCLRREGREVEANALIGLAWERFASGYASFPLAFVTDILHFARQNPFEPSETEEALANLVARLPKDATHIGSLDARVRSAVPADSVARAEEPPTNATLVAALTPRRLEVLKLVGKGLTNREIGGVLEISEHTAKAHVAGLLEALDLSNRTEAAVALREYEAVFGSDEA